MKFMVCWLSSATINVRLTKQFIISLLKSNILMVLAGPSAFVAQKGSFRFSFDLSTTKTTFKSQHHQTFHFDRWWMWRINVLGL